MIVYKITDGMAHDLRYEEDSYILNTGEISLPGWGALPALESLHSPEALDGLAMREQLTAKRAAALRAIDEQRLEAAAADPDSPQEVKDYIALRSIAPVDVRAGK